MSIKKIVLAYSGGLDTTIIIPWLKENYNDAEIIAVCTDVGQDEDLSGLEEKAIKSGASKYFLADVKEEFVKDFLFPLIRSGAMYEGKYLLGTSIARPLQAKHQVKIAPPMAVHTTEPIKISSLCSFCALYLLNSSCQFSP